MNSVLMYYVVCAYLCYGTETASMSSATVLLSHCRVLLYHPDSTQNTTVPVPKLSVLSMPTLLTKMKMVGQPLLGSIKRRTKKAKKQEKKIKVSTAGMKVQSGIDQLFLE